MNSIIIQNAVTRRALLGGLATVTVTAAMPAFALTPALLKGAGDFRHLSMVNDKTGEWLNTVYWAEGEYIPEALEAFNRILRDWRENMTYQMDPHALDILSATQKLLDSDEPFQIVSGYRTRKTNAMLRRRSRKVARNSYHIKGMAVDIAMKTRSVRQISRAGLLLGAGGVGRYSRSQFVHLDSGPVRKWGR
ncbi:MAG: YcbK family protein [Alphaproteobacteria bacterium]